MTLYEAAVKADNDFQVELVKVYGKEAAEKRYLPSWKLRGYALQNAKSAKLAADERLRLASK